MVLRTLETIGPQHGYGLARRIEQTSGDLLQLNYGTLYPALLKLEQEGYIRSHWESLTTIAAPNSTTSPRQASDRCARQLRTGNKPLKSCPASWPRPRSYDAH